MMEIKSFDLDYVLANDQILFNVNNLYENQPEDYIKVLDSCKTSNWIDLFHDEYHSLTLNNLNWMKEAFKIGSITNKFSKIYDEELQD